MEDNNSSSIFSDELKLDLQDLGYLGETARWVRFLAITGMVIAGLIMVVVPVMMIFMRGMGGGLPIGSYFAGGAFISVFYLLIGGFYFYISLLMYRYGKYLKSAIDNLDQADLSEAFRNQNNFFKIAGIITAVYLGLMVFALIIGIFTVLFASTRI